VSDISLKCSMVTLIGCVKLAFGKALRLVTSGSNKIDSKTEYLDAKNYRDIYPNNFH